MAKSTRKKAIRMIDDPVYVGFTVPQDMAERLDALVRKRMAPRAFIMREAIAMYLKSTEEQV